ncbi:hypothetical protein Taro_052354, partial [Colocasia esculenta]|nr:hypothetical protein [Colocasia esculenta]
PHSVAIPSPPPLSLPLSLSLGLDQHGPLAAAAQAHRRIGAGIAPRDARPAPRPAARPSAGRLQNPSYLSGPGRIGFDVHGCRSIFKLYIIDGKIQAVITNIS